MEWERFSTDVIERRLAALMGARSEIDGQMLMVLEELDRRQVATADGSRSLSEWVAARLDVGSDTAKTLVRTMRRTGERPDLRRALTSGKASLDRIEALSRIRKDVGLMLHVDVAAVRRQAARQAEVSAAAENRSADNRFLVMQPSLEDSWWKIWGGLDGPSGAIVDQVLTERADQLSELPDGITGDLSWRRATALVDLCETEDPPPAHVTLFVEASEAVESNGRSGVVLEAGPRVGAEALHAVLCDSVLEVIARTEDGRYLDYGRRMRTVPPALRRALVDRYGHACAIDGCESRYRLEAHHKTPWSQGGATDQDDLILLCWFHHQIVVHERGYEIFAHPVHGRIRLRPPRTP